MHSGGILCRSQSGVCSLCGAALAGGRSCQPCALWNLLTQGVHGAAPAPPLSSSRKGLTALAEPPCSSPASQLRPSASALFLQWPVSWKPWFSVFGQCRGGFLWEGESGCWHFSSVKGVVFRICSYNFTLYHVFVKCLFRMTHLGGVCTPGSESRLSTAKRAEWGCWSQWRWSVHSCHFLCVPQVVRGLSGPRVVMDIWKGVFLY